MTDERKAELRGLEPREPMTHVLKCWPEYYEAVIGGEKTFEVRKWDRPYRVGDTLLLKEYNQVDATLFYSPSVISNSSQLSSKSAIFCSSVSCTTLS